MGLSSSSDQWCRHSDRALEGLLFAKKIADDILVWADDLPTLYDRIRSIATKCQDLNIVLSKKKFKIGTEIPFAGLIISAKGVCANSCFVEVPYPDRHYWSTIFSWSCQPVVRVYSRLCTYGSLAT